MVVMVEVPPVGSVPVAMLVRSPPGAAVHES